MIKNEDTYCTVQHKIVRELGAWEAVVYGTIANLLRKTDGYGNVSNDTLINLIGRDKKSIYRWIDRLVDAGYLEKVGGKGRGNISIYYITKKGGKLTPFEEEKRGQIDTEKGANMTEKGGDMTPFEKEEARKDINKGKKESGGDNAHDAREIPTLSTTTTFFEKEENINQNKNENQITMEDFKEFWILYPGDPEWSHEKEACERAWYATQQNWRDNLVQQLRNGQRWRPIDKTNRERNNPIWYIKNYSGESAQGELPYLRGGTATFGKWAEKNKNAGVRMCLIHYEGLVAYCLWSDIQTMINAGAKVLNDNWK